MKKTTFKHFLTTLREARQPELKYSPVKVGKTIKGTIVKLEKGQASGMTQLVRSYHRIEEAIEKLQNIREKQNARIKDTFDELFDVEDALLTRIVETAGVTVQLSARAAPKHKVTTSINFEKIIEDMRALLDDDLSAKLDEIIKLNTEITEGFTTPKSPALTVKRTELKEGLMDDVIETVKKHIATFIRSFNRWSAKFDKKLDKIKEQLTEE